jgi:hypothetical protein
LLLPLSRWAASEPDERLEENSATKPEGGTLCCVKEAAVLASKTGKGARG